jgi:cytoskeletal protein RodZ
MDAVQMADTTQIAVAVRTSNHLQTATSIWLWIALIELIIIVWLLFKLRKQNNPQLDLKNVKKSDLKKSSEDVNMGDLVNSIYKSRELYKELSKRCHPDRFVNTDLEVIAEKLFQEISKNKRNYKQLVALKAEAINKLNLKF